MGYCYTRGGMLVCDRCDSPTAKKRKCTHKVDGLPYCPAPALCDECLALAGGLAELHKNCKGPAERSQERHDEDRRQLAAGRYAWRAGWGDWHANVPAGMVGVLFSGLAGEVYRLVPAVVRPIVAGIPATRYLDEYPNAIEWQGPHKCDA